MSAHIPDHIKFKKTGIYILHFKIVESVLRASESATRLPKSNDVSVDTKKMTILDRLALLSTQLIPQETGVGLVLSQFPRKPLLQHLQKLVDFTSHNVGVIWMIFWE